MLRTFLIVNIGWYFDRCVRASDAFEMLGKTLFDLRPFQLFDGTLLHMGMARGDFTVLLVATLILFGVSLAQEFGVRVRDAVLSRPLVLRWALLYALILFTLWTFSGSGSGTDSFMYAVF